MEVQRQEASLSPWYGALAGVVAGLLMAMIGMIATATMGMGALAMPDMIGGLILGPGVSMSGGALAALTGLMLHMLLSGLFGVIYTMTISRWIVRAPVLTGLLYGLALWGVNFYVIGSILPNASGLVQHDPVFLAVLTHLAYGAVLGLSGLGARALGAVLG
ncbi:hypothetical protein EPN52_12485 [bacterium]|nr:MAG: hypothetical protein EPN52_12485 [bacterium]